MPWLILVVGEGRSWVGSSCWLLQSLIETQVNGLVGGVFQAATIAVMGAGTLWSVGGSLATGGQGRREAWALVG